VRGTWHAPRPGGEVVRCVLRRAYGSETGFAAVLRGSLRGAAPGIVHTRASADAVSSRPGARRLGSTSSLRTPGRLLRRAMRMLGEQPIAWAVCVILLALLAAGLPGQLRREVSEIRAHAGRSTARADLLAPFVRSPAGWPSGRPDVRFAALLRRVVPEDAIVGVRGSPDATWLRALAFAAAPRLFVAEDASTRWLVGRRRLGTDVPAGRRWERGEYWLVRR
jgi:hypothetical protein